MGLTIVDLKRSIVALDAENARLRLLLEEMRDHASEHATQWKDGAGSHHHPIWGRVAEAIKR